MANKGFPFERQLCHKLSEWWSGADDCVFWRTAGSGGRMTNRRKRGKSAKFHCGDIAAIDPSGQPFMDLFAVEAKRGYTRVTPFDLLDKPAHAAKQKWQEWLEQAEAARANSRAESWLIIHRRDKREAMVFLPRSVWRMFRGVGDFTIVFEAEIGGESMDVVGLRLDDLLASITRDEVKRVLKCLRSRGREVA